jgi:hypothetical protein
MKMPRWIKFVALFMLVFALVDVCSPEHCDAQVLSSAQGTCQIQVQHDSDGGSGCPYEEDCFNCAHYSPGVIYTFQPVAMVSNTEPDSFPLTLDGTPLIPYHPPRA